MASVLTEKLHINWFSGCINLLYRNFHIEEQRVTVYLKVVAWLALDMLFNALQSVHLPNIEPITSMLNIQLFTIKYDYCTLILAKRLKQWLSLLVRNENIISYAFP